MKYYEYERKYIGIRFGYRYKHYKYIRNYKSTMKTHKIETSKS